MCLFSPRACPSGSWSAAGDRILAIDGRSVERYSFQQASGLLYGKPGSSVDLRILRSGNGATIMPSRPYESSNWVFFVTPGRVTEMWSISPNEK
ncbi:MAG: hypothetical protein HZB43_10170 [candidate division Zixibacteria bacterium]|nr:hypothetical protein [candidate division Zixibacteria bacterium]